MKPLAPIIDQMRVIAEEEVPAPRTCRVQLYDDGTFRASIEHSMGSQERQAIIYDRTTSEIYWEHVKGARTQSTPLTGGETILEPVMDEQEVRVIATVEPPYKQGRDSRRFSTKDIVELMDLEMVVKKFVDDFDR